LKNASFVGFGAVPRKRDGAKAYLYFKKQAEALFDFRGARNAEDTSRVTLLACLNNGYIEGSADTLNLCGQTVRNHLKHQEPERILQANTDLLQEMKRYGAFSRLLTLAIDLHDEMYYGDPETQGVAGTRPKRGSYYAYRFATASVLLDGQRFTLAVQPIDKLSVLEHVRQLISQVLDLGIRVRLILFDRGYFSTALINYLNTLPFDYIIQLPASIKGLKEGEDRLYTTRRHGTRKRDQATFRLVTLRGRDFHGKVKLFIFATNTSLKPRRIRRLFRKRWGIETSYRMIRKFLAKTTSRRYRVRLLYFYLAVVLYNLWVKLNFRQEEPFSADVLRLHLMMLLAVSFLLDLEKPIDDSQSLPEELWS
jgi:hypothetical protein